MRKTKKHKTYSIEEKNEIVELFLSKKMRTEAIVRKYDICSRSTLYKWINQYREFGTCVDRRGKATKEQAPNKGRTKKHKVDLNELSKEVLIERIKMYEDIKKSIAYLLKEQQK